MNKYLVFLYDAETIGIEVLADYYTIHPTGYLDFTIVIKEGETTRYKTVASFKDWDYVRLVNGS